MSVTLMLVVALAPLAFLLAVMVLGACRASAEDDRMRRAALARVCSGGVAPGGVAA